MTIIPEKPTPWRKVFAQFGMTQAELARAIGANRSKINVALKDDEGLISPRDQLALMKAAKRARIKLRPADLLPVIS